MHNSQPPRRRRLTIAALAATAALTLTASVADAARIKCPNCVPETFLLSKSLSGGVPNGPSRNATIAQNERIASVVAYESDASDIVAGDTNGRTDVFAIDRATPYNGNNGTEWNEGRTRLISRGLGGGPANGRSYLPAVGGASGGTVGVAPRCVAFVSEASNLVRGDTNGKADAFVADLRTGRIRRVSVNSARKQSNGTTYDVSVNGTCDRVSFTSDASNLALTRGGKPGWRPLRTRAPKGGTKQVYVHQFAGGGKARYLRGLTFLASARGRKPGNGDSYDAVLPSRAGDSVAFTSDATNLARGDGNGASDVYWRTMALQRGRFGKAFVPTLRGGTSLVSRTPSGRAGNGASRNAAISGASQFTQAGQYIGYESDATDIASNLPDRNATTDIIRARILRGRVSSNYASNGQYRREVGNGPAANPAISEAGQFLFYDSRASDYLAHPSPYKTDRNGTVDDVFLWTLLRGGSIVDMYNDNDDPPLQMPMRKPQTSARGNYATFESADPLADPALAAREGYLASASAARTRAAQDPRFSQVYMRYIGAQ